MSTVYQNDLIDQHQLLTPFYFYGVLNKSKESPTAQKNWESQQWLHHWVGGVICHTAQVSMQFVAPIAIFDREIRVLYRLADS